ncbi:hypothetical protein SDC9_206429 [bioreactor metagenome]|uniref:Uncharacterized protein n=1 Tax=bioreactor metagenome TaxID=1076179 RepID=A0A645J5Q2_9ZZZZ
MAEDEGIPRHFSHRFVSGAADDQRCPGDGPLEIGEFLGNVPGQPVLQTEHAVGGNGTDRRDHPRAFSHCSRLSVRVMAGVARPL